MRLKTQNYDNIMVMTRVQAPSLAPRGGVFRYGMVGMAGFGKLSHVVVDACTYLLMCVAPPVVLGVWSMAVLFIPLLVM